MITVIILHSAHPAIYKMPLGKTVNHLLEHWISDTGQMIEASSMKLITFDGYTLMEDMNVENIPLCDVDTRCVKAVSRNLSPEAASIAAALALDSAADDISSTRERQRSLEKKMHAAGLLVDDEDGDGEYRLAADLSQTAFECRENFALRYRMDVASIRLRNNCDELLLDDVPLEDQGVTSNTDLLIEKARRVTVHVVSRLWSRSKQVYTFCDQSVIETLLEKNIPVKDQRICLNGYRLSPTSSTTAVDVFGDDLFASTLPLEITVVLREPVILNRGQHSRAVSVWPEDRVSCLLSVEPEKDPTPLQVEQPLSERWAYKKELITDVLFSDIEEQETGKIFYRGKELDKTKSFENLAIPPFAVISVDPPQLMFDKDYDFNISLNVPIISTIADVRERLLRERPSLYSEDFEFFISERRHLDPSSSTLADWGLKNGDKITIEPIRVPHVVLIRRH